MIESNHICVNAINLYKRRAFSIGIGWGYVYPIITNKIMIYLVLDRPYTCMPFSKYKGKKKTEVDGDEAIPC